MDDRAAPAVHLLHTLPGRARIHLAGWAGADLEGIETRLGAATGITAVRLNRCTANLLIHFDPQRTGLPDILATLRRLQADPPLEAAPPDPARRASPHERSSRIRTGALLSGVAAVRSPMADPGRAILLSVAARLALRLMLGPAGATLALRLIAAARAALQPDPRYPRALQISLILLGL